MSQQRQAAAARRQPTKAATPKPHAATDRRPAGGPQEYDASGFPIPQQLPSFVERVRRLLAG